MTNKHKITRDSAAEAFEAARIAAEAARVPASDRAASGIAGGDPVTMDGWYPVTTVSGRAAWALYTWRAGRLDEDRCTYDRDAEDRLSDAAQRSYDADQAARDHGVYGE